jgi:hypothetical protein
MPMLIVGDDSCEVSDAWIATLEVLRQAWQFETISDVVVRCAALVNFLQQQEEHYGAMTSLSYPVGSWQKVYIVPSEEERLLFQRKPPTPGCEAARDQAANDDFYTC